MTGGAPDDADDDTAASEFDWTDSSVSEAVVAGVAARSDRNRDELAELDDVVDVDSMNRLFESIGPDRSVSEGSVTFRYEGHLVRVFSYGTVEVSLSRES